MKLMIAASLFEFGACDSHTRERFSGRDKVRIQLQCTPKVRDRLLETGLIVSCSGV